MSKKPNKATPKPELQGDGTYSHPTTCDDDQARRLSRLCIRDQQSFALVRDGQRWAMWCPDTDEGRFVGLIEQSESV